MNGRARKCVSAGRCFFCDAIFSFFNRYYFVLDVSSCIGIPNAIIFCFKWVAKISIRFFTSLLGITKAELTTYSVSKYEGFTPKI